MQTKLSQAKLSKHLREQGYDLIEGPIRNYKLLQLWLKKAGNPAELYYRSVQHAFTSETLLEPTLNASLKVTHRQKNEYKFNMGMSVLDPVLTALGLNNIELESLIKTGKSVSIAYENSETTEVSLGLIEQYLHTADYLHPNPSLFKHANRDQIMIISGVLMAKNLVVNIETDFDVSPSLIASLDQKTAGKLNTFKKNNRALKMVSEGNRLFPIAVKAHRLHFDKGHFVKSNLVTDSRAFF